MFVSQTNIRNLNATGTNQDMSSYRGFTGQITNLKLLLCVYHLQRYEKGALTKIICDIYGRNYGGVKQLGVVDLTNTDDFRISVGSIKVFGIIHAQAFINGSLKSELLF